MKKLSDYKDEEAIELWADLIEPMSTIFADGKVRELYGSNITKIEMAKMILKLHPKESIDILKSIDPTPVDGLNIIFRLIALLTDLGRSNEFESFFGFAEQEQTESESSGSATVITLAENQ